MIDIEWAVPLAHPAFPGHFPGRPILPGVVLIDQAIRLGAGILSPGVAISGLGNAKFFQPVLPGTVLTFRFPQPSATAQGFEIMEGDKIVASGSLSLESTQ